MLILSWKCILYSISNLTSESYIYVILDKMFLFFSPKFYFFSCNFWTRYARKPIEGSKDSDYSLVSTNDFSQKLALAVGAQGPMTLAKLPKHTPLMTSPTKHPNLKFSNFFQCKLENLPHLFRIWTAFLFHHLVSYGVAKIAAHTGFWSTNISYTGTEGVKPTSLFLIVKENIVCI